VLPEPLTNFHLFPKLPAEIVDRIWKLSCPQRIIEVQVHNTGDNKRQYSCSTAKPVPAFLVCKDSRNSVLPFYPRCFNSSIRANLSLDTIYLDRTLEESVLDFFCDLSPKEMEELTSIAFCDEFLDRADLDNNPNPRAAKWNKIWERLKRYLQQLPSLRECKISVDVEFASHRIKEPMVSDQTKAIEFVKEIPDELMKRASELMILKNWKKIEDFPPYIGAEWVHPIAKYVYGWRPEAELHIRDYVSGAIEDNR
jgi:2EXR family